VELRLINPSLIMAATGEHTHHIKIRSTQMEMPSGTNSSREDDYDRKLKDAQEELERIQQQREELERKKSELEELTSRKRTFISQQVELTEKLTASLTLIDRGLYEMRQETEDLEQCRVCFAAHLDKIQKYNPETWTRDNLSEKLERASMAIDIAADEYDQAAAHFEGGRSGAIFGRASKRSGRAATRSQKENSEFINNLRNGFAFNLPIVVLGGLALLIYLAK
jgi:vacuolar-type H+-ATPase subunit I/STV1